MDAPLRDNFDASGMTLSQCCYCAHVHTLGEIPLSCDAFPAGVPDDILFNRLDHREPIEGDNGVQFQLRAGLAAEAALIVARSQDAAGGGS